MAGGLRAYGFWFAGVLLLAVGLDQGTKELARQWLGGQPTLSYIADVVRFDLVLNPGGFLSLGANLPVFWREAFFVGFVPLLLVTLCVVMIRAGLETRAEWTALGLVAGGGLGNWIDRMWQDGAVTDFVSLGVGPVRTGIFNVADVVIIIGSALLLLTAWRAPQDDAESVDAAAEAAPPEELR